MLHTKTITVPTKTVEIKDHCTCDLCGAKIPEHNFNKYDISVECTEDKNDFSITNATSSVIFLRKRTYVDLCIKCFKEKLVPWLKENGAAIQEEDTF